MPYVFSIQAASVLPSHRLTGIPASVGRARKTRLTSRICAAFKRGGRPERSPSVKPANPWSSNRRTQYSTVRGASPSRRPASGQVNPCATSKTPCSRWSYRDSSERWISCCNPTTIEAASEMVSGFIVPANHTWLSCAIIYDAMFKTRLLTVLCSGGSRCFRRCAELRGQYSC